MHDDEKIDNTDPNMTYYCPNCDKEYPISTLSIVQDASVSFQPVFSGGRWHTTPPEMDMVNLYDEIDCYCGECNGALPEPNTSHDFWMYADELPEWYNRDEPWWKQTLPDGTSGAAIILPDE